MTKIDELARTTDGPTNQDRATLGEQALTAVSALLGFMFIASLFIFALLGLSLLGLVALVTWVFWLPSSILNGLLPKR